MKNTAAFVLVAALYQTGDFERDSTLLVWAVLMYRRPVASGICLGTAAGLVYYPLFLLPLWATFYGRRSAVRFCAALAAVGTVLRFGPVLLFGAYAGTVKRSGFGWANPLYTKRELTHQLKDAGVEYRAGSFPFAANARARALGDTSGFVKVLSQKETDEILGVHIIGPFAGELIAEAAVAMAFRASSEDIGIICHAHPSLSEALKDAALAVDKRALNI